MRGAPSDAALILLSKSPEEETEGGDDESDHANFVDAPVERRKIHVGEGAVEPLGVNHIYGHNVKPNQQREHEHC